MTTITRQISSGDAVLCIGCFVIQPLLLLAAATDA